MTYLMGEYFIQIIWFFLPAGIANMAAAISRYIPLFNYPVDFYKTLGGKAIFGPHKTYRGVFFGVLSAIIFVYIQRYFYQQGNIYTLVDYRSDDIWLLGLLLGLGSVLGDLGRSFIKRQVGLAPGRTWFPWDQIDWIIGAIIFSYGYVHLDWRLVLGSLFIAAMVHPLVNYLCYLAKLQKNKL